MNRKRLHLRLMVTVLGLFSLLWLLAWFYMSSAVAEQAEAETDNSLRQFATSIMVGWNGAVSRQPTNGDAVSGPESQVATSPSGTVPEFAVIDSDERQLLRSAHFPDLDPGPVELGFRKVAAGGEWWRVLTVHDERTGLYCQVAIRVDQTEVRSHELTATFASPILISLPVFTLAVCLGVWRGLNPLRSMSRQLMQRNENSLAPISVPDSNLVRELEPVVEAINRLIHRLSQTLNAQRAFTAAIGHELRTPLSGIQSQVQAALATGSVEAESRAMHKIPGAIAQMEQTTRRLLILARMTREDPLAEYEPMHLHEVINNAVESRQSQLAEKQLDCTLKLDALPDKLVGDATLIRVLLDNLIDNAIKYSPSNGRITIATSSCPPGIRLAVGDEGPGIPEHEHARVLEPFHRDEGAGVGNHGLGLYLVNAIARAHRGSVRIDRSEYGGALVMAEFTDTVDPHDITIRSEGRN